MKLERIALVWLHEAIPWAPIMLGFRAGLEAHGVQTVAAAAGPAWLQAEMVKRFEPHAVVFAVHHQMREHVPAWRGLIDGRVPFAALCFDDPYDSETTLVLAKFFDLLITPEQCALEPYRDRGHRTAWLQPTVCDVWHRPRPFAVDKGVDVLHVGNRASSPRKEFLPALARYLGGRSITFGEAAGNRRWLVGADLTNALHSARVTFDLPRGEYTTSNPLRIPCTYVGPRIHIAAACGVPCVCVDARGSLLDSYPDALECTTAAAFETIADLASVGSEPRRIELAAKNLERFRAEHAPYVAAARLLAILEHELYGNR